MNPPSLQSHPKAAWLVLALALLGSADGATVLMITSGEAEPYRLAAETVAADLAGHRVICSTLAQFRESQLDDASCIVAIGTAAAVAVSGRATTQRPLVYTLVADPSDAGLRQLPSVGGVSTMVSVSEQLALIAKALPQCRRIGALFRKADPRSAALIADLQANLPADWRLKAVMVDDPLDLGGPIAEVCTETDLIWTHPDSTLYQDAAIRVLLLTALRNRLPVFGFSPAFVRSGALLGTSIDPQEQGHQAAAMVRGILEKTTPADSLPHLQPVFHFAVNLVVASKLGIHLSDRFVREADQVFEGR